MGIDITRRDVSVLSIDSVATAKVAAANGGSAQEIKGLPVGTTAEVSRRPVDGSISVRLTVPASDGDKAVVLVRTFQSVAAFRKWANDDTKPMQLTGDLENDAFEKLRHTTDATSLGLESERSTGPAGAFALADSLTTFSSRMGGQVGGRQRGLIDTGFLAATSDTGKSNQDGLQGERTNKSTEAFMQWGIQAGLTQAELAGSPISQARIDRSIALASRTQSLLCDTFKQGGNDDFLQRCSFTPEQIAAYRKNPDSFMLKDHPTAFAQIFSWEEGTRGTVADALRESPRTQASQRLLVELGNPRHQAQYQFTPAHIPALERYIEACAAQEQSAPLQRTASAP